MPLFILAFIVIKHEEAKGDKDKMMRLNFDSKFIPASLRVRESILEEEE